MNEHIFREGEKALQEINAYLDTVEHNKTVHQQNVHKASQSVLQTIATLDVRSVTQKRIDRNRVEVKLYTVEGYYPLTLECSRPVKLQTLHRQFLIK